MRSIVVSTVASAAASTVGSDSMVVVPFLTSVFFSEVTVLVVFFTSFFSVFWDENEDEDEADQIR